MRGLHAPLRLLPLLLAAERGQVEAVVASRPSSRAPRPNIEYVWKIRSPSRRKQLEPGCSNGCSPRRRRPCPRVVLGLRAVVVLQRRDRLVERDVEVVVEVAAVGGVPTGTSSRLLGLVALDLLQRRARDVRQRRVARVPGGRAGRVTSSSAPAVQPGQPFSHSGSNMKCPTISCRRPSNRSSSVTLPSGRVELVLLLISTIGSRRRSAFSCVAAPGQLLLLGQQARARDSSHSSRDTTSRSVPCTRD